MLIYLFSLIYFLDNSLIPLDNRPAPPRYILFSEKIHLLPESKMYLRGGTNIGTYSCDCVSSQMQFQVVADFAGCNAQFEHAHLYVSTKNINCYNRLYNSNIKKGLEADKYDYVQIELLKAWKTDGTDFTKDCTWMDIEALTYVTIKNKSLPQRVKAKVHQISSSLFRVVGSHPLSMLNYDINVPEIMLGLVKVHDEIVFHFDLYFEIKNSPR